MSFLFFCTFKKDLIVLLVIYLLPRFWQIVSSNRFGILRNFFFLIQNNKKLKKSIDKNPRLIHLPLHGKD